MKKPPKLFVCSPKWKPEVVALKRHKPKPQANGDKTVKMAGFLKAAFTGVSAGSYAWSVSTPISGGVGIQYVASLSSGTMNVPTQTSQSITYDTYYWVTYAANVPVTLPTGEWVKSGGAATGVFDSPQYNPAGDTRYVFVSDNRPGTITAPTTITATYDTYYKVTFKQSGSTVPPTVTYRIDSGSDVTDTVEFFVWVLSGQSISYSYQNPIPNGADQFWLSSVSPSSPITVTRPATVTGNYLKLPYSAVTSSSLCPITQFKLLFIQDMQNPSTYRLTASNPGQFYYNVFYVGTPGATVTLTIEIPAPFVTQGAMPVQLYSGVSISGGCFVPSGKFAAYATTITGQSGSTIELKDITVPATGLVYVTVHLDYGYKITSGWTPDGGLNAYKDLVLTIRNNAEYTFSYTKSGSTYSATVLNVNDFKKIPGFGGVVTDGSGNPLSGETVTVNANGPSFTATTNADGFYLIEYKTGKTQTYTITVNSQTASGTINANRFVVSNFKLT